MATFLGYPFDPELFSYNWRNAQDMTLTAMLDSGAVVSDPQIAKLISNGSDTYTIPFYNVIGGEADNYDGVDNITITDVDGSAQSGIVYGRAHGWKAQDFVFDYNSGADPMRQITSQVVRYWQKQRQNRMLSILSAVFGVTGAGAFADWANHTTDISSADSTVTEDNKFGPTTGGEAMQKAVGDASDQFKLYFMHSKVATNLAGLNLLNFLKYTDPNGIERTLRIADLNGATVVVDDGVPHTADTYTTYILGLGSLRYAAAPVKVPSEITRNATAAGGYDALITRLRETIHPNGFSFTKPASGYTSSPTDAQLAASANWSIVADPKSIALARVISNG